MVILSVVFIVIFINWHTKIEWELEVIEWRMMLAQNRISQRRTRATCHNNEHTLRRCLLITAIRLIVLYQCEEEDDECL